MPVRKNQGFTDDAILEAMIDIGPATAKVISMELRGTTDWSRTISSRLKALKEQGRVRRAYSTPNGAGVWLVKAD